MSSAAAAQPDLSLSTVDRAISSLLRWLSSHDSSDDPLVNVVLSLSSAPTPSRRRRRLLSLPHPFRPFRSSTPSCLVVDDRPSSPTPPSAALSKLRSDSIPVSSVLGVTSLARSHSSFSSRKDLCRSYEIFFVDGRAVEALRRVIGEQLWRKGVTVLLLDLGNPNWREQMRKACESAFLRIVGDGRSCTVVVGKAHMGKEKLVENAAAVAKRVLEAWRDVEGIYVKSNESIALPIYRRDRDGEGEREVVVEKKRKKV